MCLTCGCLKPHDEHGNPDYLTIDELEKSAKLDKLSLDEAVWNRLKTGEVATNKPEHSHR